MKSIAARVTEMGYRDEVMVCDDCFKTYVHTFGLENGMTVEEVIGVCELCGPIDSCLVARRQSNYTKLVSTAINRLEHGRTMETYKAAQARILAGLELRGWTTKINLKIPQAISPSKEIHVYFHPQAVYDDSGLSLWIDIREMEIGAFVQHTSDRGIRKERY